MRNTTGPPNGEEGSGATTWGMDRWSRIVRFRVLPGHSREFNVSVRPPSSTTPVHRLADVAALREKSEIKHDSLRQVNIIVGIIKILVVQTLTGQVNYIRLADGKIDDELESADVIEPKTIRVNQPH